MCGRSNTVFLRELARVTKIELSKPMLLIISLQIVVPSNAVVGIPCEKVIKEPKSEFFIKCACILYTVWYSNNYYVPVFECFLRSLKASYFR